MQAKPLLAFPMFSVVEAVTKPKQPLLRKLPIFPRFPSCWRPIPCRTFLTDLTGQSTLLLYPLLTFYFLEFSYSVHNTISRFLLPYQPPFDSSCLLHIPRRASPALNVYRPAFFF